MLSSVARVCLSAALAWAHLLAAAAEPPAAAASQPVAAQRPSIADFFDPAAMRSPVLSPDGRHIAMVTTGPDGERVLAVATVDAPAAVKGLLRFGNTDVGLVRWVNERRLIFSSVDRDAAGDPAGSGVQFAIDVDGSDYRELGWQTITALLRDGSDDVIVLERAARNTMRYDAGSISPRRLDTRSGKARAIVSDDPRFAVEWVFTPQGEPAAVRSSAWDGDTRIWWRPAPGEPWQQVARYELFDTEHDVFVPLAVRPDGRMWVRARRTDAAGTAALYGYDPRSRKLDAEPTLALDGFDFTGRLIFDRRSGDLVGAEYATDALGVAWFDPRMRRIQQAVDALLPGTINLFDCDPCGGQRHFVVAALSDRQPPVYFLVDSEADGPASLQFIGAARPAIDASRMARQEFVRVPARDGLHIPVYVTIPPGKGPWPTVVMVHGGPWVRGASWGWAPESQFLASRGYLVVEPEFRGSTGYGDAWYRAGFRQWGLAMQDDVTDATRWAIAQGLADGERVAIAGASYGGYAALMGLLKEPALYRAAVSWVGVTDVELMFSLSWSDYAGGLWHREGMPALIGDPRRDAELFRQVSPLRRAREIRQPLLLAYGARDRRVPIAHGTRLREALQDAKHPALEWVVYEDEGHGFYGRTNVEDFWRRVEQFLDRHLR